MKKVLCLTLILIIIAMLIPFDVSAENIWVCDTEDALSEDTIAYVNSINSDVLSKYEADPKLALIVTSKMPDDYQNYALTMFHEYGMSKIADNYDVLLILALDDKLYHIEAGGGYETGSLIEQSLYRSMIGEDVLDDLYDEKYDEAVLKIVDYYKSMMAKQDSGEYASQQEAYDRRMLIMKIFAGIIFGLLGIGIIVYYVKSEKKKETQAARTHDIDETINNQDKEDTQTNDNKEVAD